MMLEGFLHHPQTELQKYAQVVLNHLDTYGKGITRKNYPTETAILKNILDDWQTFSYLVAALAALGLTPWQNKLKELNQQFNDLYVSRAKEAGTAQSETMKQLRDAAVDSYYDLREFINSLYVVNKKAEPFAKLISEINGLIDKYNQVASHLLNNPETPATPGSVQSTEPTQP